MGNNIGRSLSMRETPPEGRPIAEHEVAFAFGRRIIQSRARGRRADRRRDDGREATETAMAASGSGFVPTLRVGSRFTAAALGVRAFGNRFRQFGQINQKGQSPPAPGSILRAVLRGDVAHLEGLAAPPGGPASFPTGPVTTSLPGSQSGLGGNLGGNLGSAAGGGITDGAAKYLQGSWAPAASPQKSIVSSNVSQDTPGSRFVMGNGDGYTSNDKGDPLGGVVDGFEPLIAGFSLGLASTPLSALGVSAQARRLYARPMRRVGFRYDAELESISTPVFDASWTWDFGDGSANDSANANPTHQFTPGYPDFQSFSPSVDIAVTVTDPVTGNSKQWGPQNFGGGGLLDTIVGRWPTSSGVGGNNDVILTNVNGDPVENCRVLARFKSGVWVFGDFVPDGKGDSWGVYETNSSGSTGNLYGGGYGKIFTVCMRNPKLTNELDFGG